MVDKKRVFQQLKPLEEMVDHPAHYNQGEFEVIDVIEDWDLEFHEGNVVKYVARSKHKISRLEDLKKAMWYLQRKIDLLEETDGK